MAGLDALRGFSKINDSMISWNSKAFWSLSSCRFPWMSQLSLQIYEHINTEEYALEALLLQDCYWSRPREWPYLTPILLSVSQQPCLKTYHSLWVSYSLHESVLVLLLKDSVLNTWFESVLLTKLHLPSCFIQAINTVISADELMLFPKLSFLLFL